MRNQPYYAAIGVDPEGHKDILGIWPGSGGGESAKYWHSVLTEMKTWVVNDVFFIACDVLKGLPDSVNAEFPDAAVQTCIIHWIAEHLALCMEEVLRPAQPSPQTHLHGPAGDSRGRRAGRVPGQVGMGLTYDEIREDSWRNALHRFQLAHNAIHYLEVGK